jgi:hypothetical protein
MKPVAEVSKTKVAKFVVLVKKVDRCTDVSFPKKGRQIFMWLNRGRGISPPNPKTLLRLWSPHEEVIPKNFRRESAFPA